MKIYGLWVIQHNFLITLIHSNNQITQQWTSSCRSILKFETADSQHTEHSQTGPFSNSKDSHHSLSVSLYCGCLKEDSSFLFPDFDFEGFTWEDMSCESDIDWLNLFGIVVE